MGKYPMRLSELSINSPYFANKVPGKDIINQIRHECSFALEEYQLTGKLLYRGIMHPKYLIFRTKPKLDRKPLHTFKADDKLINDYMEAQGLKAIRRNSIFTSADINEARIYGHPFAVFPVNGFNFTWSRSIRDLFTGITPNNPLEQFLRQSKEIGPGSVSRFKAVFKFTPSDFAGALASGNEILINGWYWAIDLETNGGKHILRDIWK